MKITFYAKIPDSEIRLEAAEYTTKIEDWFTANPKRKICHLEAWYGIRAKIRRGHVKEDMKKVREAALKD